MIQRRFARLSSSVARLVPLAMIAFVLAIGAHFGASGWSVAQSQEIDDAAESLDPSALGLEELEPAGEGNAPRAASPGDADQAGGRTLFESLMLSGFCGLIIFLLSMVGVAMIVEHSMTIRRGVLMPDELVDRIDELIQSGNVDEAMAVTNEPGNDNLFANVVRSGLERFKSSEFGFAEYRAAAEEAGEDQTARLYRKTEVLGVIGAIAPMFGLLGTVSGMIRAFDVIAARSGMAKPHELAGGISEALITTYMGLVVAIPAMVAFSYFRNKIDSIVAEAGKRVEQIMAPLGRRR